MPPLSPQFYPPDLNAWRAWLTEHHATDRQVWLVYYKPHAQRPSISYSDSLDEALCFGWIDSLIRRIDDDSYARLFTPRSNTARWSAVNRKRIKELIAAERVMPAGLAVLPQDLDAQPVERPHPEHEELPEFIQQALDQQAGLREKFEALSPSVRRGYLNFILDAKREETRQKRLVFVLENVASGQKIDFMKPLKYG
jgi:uncharacterized protein YdeI (YjbR/CyaY-like superfamily)